MMFKSFPFDENSIEYKRSAILRLLSILTFIILLIDLANEVIHGYYLLAVLEVIVIITILLNLVIFLRSFNLVTASFILVSLISFLAIISLQIDGYGKESALFWTASLPLYIFILLGARRGLYLSSINLTALFSVLMIAVFEWLPALFSVDLLFQMTVGYIAITILIYYFEKIRGNFEKRLHAMVHERDILLLEINHRVKNNMQIIISMLRLQADRYGDDIKEVVTVAENRIRSMLSIHELLYMSKDLSQVDTKLYITKLIAEIGKSFSTKDKEIIAQVTGEFLPMEILTQLGFIINELVTNAIKYAYNESGVKIHVSIMADDALVTLEVRDNGITSSCDAEEGLGTVFVRTIIEEQLQGNLEIYQDKGRVARVKFLKTL